MQERSQRQQSGAGYSLSVCNFVHLREDLACGACVRGSGNTGSAGEGMDGSSSRTGGLLGRSQCEPRAGAGLWVITPAMGKMSPASVAIPALLGLGSGCVHVTSALVR